MNKNSLHFLSFDVEEWWSVHSFADFRKKNPKTVFEDRIDISIDIILDLLGKYQTKATFFVLGRVADKFPDIVRKIADEGHDIGSHGYDHVLIYDQTPEEFENDLQKSLKALEYITKNRIETYRAPSYSITRKSLWALEILEKNGIKIDSSIIPSQNSRFGIDTAPAEPFWIDFGGSKGHIFEIPPTTFKILGRRIPLCSGFFFRIIPYWLIDTVFQKKIKQAVPSMLILHNWEIDTHHPRINAGIKACLIHYFGLAKTEKKLIKLLEKYYHNPLQLVGHCNSMKFEKLIQ